MTYQKFKTSMDYLQKAIDKFKYVRVKNQRPLIEFSECLTPVDDLNGAVWYPQVDKIIELIRETRADISLMWNKETELTNNQKRKYT